MSSGPMDVFPRPPGSNQISRSAIAAFRFLLLRRKLLPEAEILPF